MIDFMADIGGGVGQDGVEGIFWDSCIFILLRRWHLGLEPEPFEEPWALILFILHYNELSGPRSKVGSKHVQIGEE
jgi:hypothetical protein